MNKKAQLGIAFSVIVAIMIFMVGMLNLDFIKQEITRARTASGLDCSGTISDGTKLTCLVVDLVVPIFIVTIFSFAGGMLTRWLV